MKTRFSSMHHAAFIALSVLSLGLPTQAIAAPSLPNGIECAQPYLYDPSQGSSTERTYLEHKYIGARNTCHRQIVAVICVQKASDGMWVSYFGVPKRVEPQSYWADVLHNDNQYKAVNAIGCYENTHCKNFLSNICSEFH